MTISGDIEKAGEVLLDLLTNGVGNSSGLLLRELQSTLATCSYQPKEGQRSKWHKTFEKGLFCFTVVENVQPKSTPYSAERTQVIGFVSRQEHNKLHFSFFSDGDVLQPSTRVYQVHGIHCPGYPVTIHSISSAKWVLKTLHNAGYSFPEEVILNSVRQYGHGAADIQCVNNFEIYSFEERGKFTLCMNTGVGPVTKIIRDGSKCLNEELCLVKYLSKGNGVILREVFGISGLPDIVDYKKTIHARKIFRHIMEGPRTDAFCLKME